MQNCYEYLLTVAQKIILQFADHKTIDKYINLKNKLLTKVTIQSQNSHLAFSTLSKENIKYQILKTSVVDENVKKKSRCSSRPSTTKSKSKQTGQLSRARMQSYLSKATQESNINSQRQEHGTLLHIATVLKNAQSCPSLLKTITFCANSLNSRANTVLESIAGSIKAIYYQLTRQDISKAQIKQEQLIKDNKWLLNKLQAIVDQNTTLRRMVGHRVY